MVNYLKFLLAIIAIPLISCGFGMELPGYRFTNFRDTPAWDLAEAVRDNDGERVTAILASSTLSVDYKDPKFEQTLLILSIANKKYEAFLALLEAGANPDEVCGNKGDVTPLLTAIDFEEECGSDYMISLIKYGANVNKYVEYEENGYQKKIIPLLKAANKSDKEGNDCVALLKLLIDNGANENSCVYSPAYNRCAGIIENSLRGRSIENLRYLIVDKKIPLPDSIYVSATYTWKAANYQTWDEVLNSKEYTYSLSPAAEKAKLEILEYLKRQKQ